MGGVSEYANVDARTNFFKSTDVPFVNTIHDHAIGSGSQLLRFILKNMIIDTVIGDMLFRPDDVDGVTKKIALKI